MAARLAAALLLVAAALPLAAAAEGWLGLSHRRRLAQVDFPKPEACDRISETDFNSAFASLTALCPQTAPWSCDGECFDGMRKLNYKCAHAAAIAAAQAAGLDAKAATDRIASLFRTCPGAVLEHDDGADIPPLLSPPLPSPASTSPSPEVDPSLLPSPSLDNPSAEPGGLPSPTPDQPDPAAVPGGVQPSTNPTAVETFAPQPQTPTPTQVVPMTPAATPRPSPSPSPPPPTRSPPPPQPRPPPPKLAPPPPKVIPGGPNCPYNCCRYAWPPCSFYQK